MHCYEAFGAGLGGACTSADLGYSSDENSVGVLVSSPSGEWSLIVGNGWHPLYAC